MACPIPQGGHNVEVLQGVNETKTMLDTVKKRKRVVRACAKT